MLIWFLSEHQNVVAPQRHCTGFATSCKLLRATAFGHDQWSWPGAMHRLPIPHRVAVKLAYIAFTHSARRIGQQALLRPGPFGEGRDIALKIADATDTVGDVGGF